MTQWRLQAKSLLLAGFSPRFELHFKDLIGWHLSTLVPPNQMEVHMHWQFEIYTVA
jgi:hypothetical protein